MRPSAIVLDLDGVLTETAALHERAWKALFDPILREHDQPPFTRRDYRRFVDGKPRLDGIRDFLAHRGIPVGDEEVARLGDHKNEHFRRLLEREGVELYTDNVDVVRRWREQGLRIAIVSSSRNAREVLTRAKLDDLYDARVDGQDLSELELPGKPAPDAFLEAARRLGVDPARAIAVEDAEPGVEAAVAAGYGCVIGIRREGDRDALHRLGADRVVASLAELDLDEAVTTRDPDELPSALDATALREALGGRTPAVFLDYDGTLTPIVDHPARAWLDESVRFAVRRLAERTTVALVSGRDLDDVRARVGLGGVWYAGSHGFDVLGPDGQRMQHEAGRRALPALDAAEEALRERLHGVEGIVIERKRFGIAVHYRLASDDGAALAREAVDELAVEGLRVGTGKMVLELRPDVDWDKGRALEWILDNLGLDESVYVPVFVGDDRTDEDAFRALARRGVGVLVGSHGRRTRAHLRVADPHEVRLLVDQLAGPERPVDPWRLEYDRWDPEQQPLREALLTLGNGYFATRGAFEESPAGGPHYPGTYLAGGYDRLDTDVRGMILVNEDLVNWPNWLVLSFRREGGEWLALERMEVLSFRTWLDLREGRLERHLVVRDRDGNETELRACRIVSMHEPHVAGVRWEVTPRNWSGRLELRTGLDGSVRNEGVARYRALRGDHLVREAVGDDNDEVLWLVVSTHQSRMRMAQVARTHVNRRIERSTLHRFEDRILRDLTVRASEGDTVRVEKIVVIRTSRDHATSEPLHDARYQLRHTGSFDDLARRHGRAWAGLWQRVDLELDEGNRRSQAILRLYLFHLLQVISPHIVDRDVGAPARGLHGEAYRGHVFWDELFMFPALTYSFPELTRELLLYRYRRIESARCLARESGHRGALFPWQSGSNGREESQVLHLNPNSGRWVPDDTHLQRHIAAAVAYNVWQYHETTGDLAFLSRYGAEMMLEIARFWASIATWDDRFERYRIRGVVGPDEYHTAYPDRDRPGLDDNAYTNVMAAWCLRTAEQALSCLDDERRRELLDELGITDEDRAQWQQIAARLRVPFTREGLIAQFEGYDELLEFDWDGYRARYGDIQRLDRILEAEGDTPNRYKASKQADVLMLFFLFSADELCELLASMGYDFDRNRIPEHVEYYLRRTSHGSTLSRVVHSWVLARTDRARSWHLFQVALRSDVEDIQGGTTAEGIHLGALAGVVDLVYRGYTGAVILDGVLWLEPSLPHELRSVSLRFRVHGAWLDVRVDHRELRVAYRTGWPEVARIGMHGAVHEVRRGGSRTFALADAVSQVREEGTPEHA